MNRSRLLLHLPALLVLLILAILSARAQSQLSPELRQKIDKLANESLAKSGVSATHACSQRGIAGASRRG